MNVLRVWSLILSVCAVCAGQQEAREADVSAVRSLYRSGKWQEAVEAATAAPVRSADLELLLGLSLARMDQFDRAEAAFAIGRVSYPGDARFALELAGVAYRRGNFRNAKRLLRQALQIDSRSEYGNSFLGALFLMEGNLPATLTYWNRVGKPILQDVHLAPIPALDPLLRDRALWVAGGQLLSARRFAMTTANLDRLGAFSTYQFELTPASNGRYDLTFRSLGKGLPTKGWLTLVPYVRGLPYQTVLLDFRNLGERALHVDSLLRWDSQKRRVAFNVEGPWKLSPRRRFRVGMDARDEIWDLTPSATAASAAIDGLVFRKASVEAGIDHALTERIEWGVGVGSAYRSYRHATGSSLFSEGWSAEVFSGVRARLWSSPERRMRLDGSARLRTGRLFAPSPLPYTGLSARTRFVWYPQAKGDDVAVAASMQAGRLFGTPPFDELYMLGMERDNDLWMRGRAGTRAGRKGSAPMGTEYGLLQSELDRTVLRLPLFRLQLGPFLDAGRVGDRWRAFGSRGWLVDTGVQAKIRAFGGFTWTVVYGRDLRGGRGVFYTAIAR